MPGKNIVQLPDGAVVAFQEYGDPLGTPVIFCHGWPSSRTMAQLADESAHTLGIRVISPDRPGISASSMQLDRKLSDWPRVVEQLVNDLEIGEFRILAISGGAPYAYATAIAMPERVRAIAVVGGVIPFGELKDFKGLLPLYRWMLAFYRNQPQVLRQLFRLAQPFLAFRAPIRLRPLLLKMLLLRPCDAASLRDDAAFEAVFESQRRAWRGSVEGVLVDAQIYAQPWGFVVEDVQVPVRLWHGIEDRAFAVRLAEEIASRFQHCKARFVPNEGHYSLPIRYIRDILEDLISV
ncbi:MAG TPA: alpha/beta hydrolase [Candidatus Babeliales bacterium]|jgi:pimeloyl-ACP methyl ester carboxylesterase|nr:alpha/beta hydrolase [Candidatus Babeliales bacterium]